jgi:hypothetical protein
MSFVGKCRHIWQAGEASGTVDSVAADASITTLPMPAQLLIKRPATGVKNVNGLPTQ